MRQPRARFLAASLCALALVLALPSAAIAAPRSAPALAPLASGPIDAQIWPAQEGNTTVVIIDVTLDSKVKLPARVRIPVPKNAVVEWAGEILSGDASTDKERTFTLQDGQGGSFAEFTLSVSHRAQIETSGIAMTANGTLLTTQVDWIQSVPSTSTLFTVRIPALVSAVNIDPKPEGAPDTNANGESLYVLPMQKLATGSQSAIKVSYDTAPATATPTTTVNLTAVYLVLGVLLAGAVAVVFYLMGHQASAGSDDAGYDDAEDSATQPDGTEVAEEAPSAQADDDDDEFDVDFE